MPRNDFLPGDRSSLRLDEDEHRDYIEWINGPAEHDPGDEKADLPIINSTECPNCGVGVGERCFEGRDDFVHLERQIKWVKGR